jgi:hypothetical protein
MAQATEHLVRRIRGEFLEMPGLSLTIGQARRLWGLESSLCEASLDALVRSGFLTRTRDGRYLRLDTSVTF